jgi:hypothetical protein
MESTIDKKGGYVMRTETYLDTLPEISPPDHEHPDNNYVWATTEKAKQRTLALYLIQSIAQRHGGTAEVDLATDTISINVPDDEQAACAQEIEEQIGHLYD